MDRRMTYRERKEARFAQRVQKWEDRLAGPPPPKHWHRVVVTVLMMLAMLALLYVLLFTHGPSTQASASGHITSRDIKDGTIQSRDVKDNALLGRDVRNGSLTASDLANHAVGSAQLKDGSVGPDAMASVPAVSVRTTANTNILEHDTIIGVHDLQFGSEAFDTASMWSPADSKHVIIPRDGVYEVMAVAIWSTYATGWREMQVRKTPAAGGGPVVVGDTVTAPVETTITTQHDAFLVKLAAGDKLALGMYWLDNPVGSTTIGVQAQSGLDVRWVGP